MTSADGGRRERSLSFGSQAAAYERGRPSYPPEAVDWLLPEGARDVLDLGAGTGKLTSRLVERGLAVVAVDPIAELLDVLRTTLPDTPALLGSAEQIPLPDNSIDVVLVAQAWHWFDPDRAGAEIARVLRPGHNPCGCLPHRPAARCHRGSVCRPASHRSQWCARAKRAGHPSQRGQSLARARRSCRRRP